MLVIDSAALHTLDLMPRLIEALREAFRAHFEVPQRQVMGMPGGAGDRLLVSMPAFDAEGLAAVKLATILPDNPERGLPTIQAAVIVFSRHGTPVALLDGTSLTHLRTGAASALASTYLSRADSEHLLIIGTGALAPAMAEAHCSVRPIKRVSVWGRRRERAEATAEVIGARIGAAIETRAVDSLEQAVETADIVSCATSSATPVLAGRWLKAGTFVDLVGSFSPVMRESDDDVVLRARIFVDTFAGALIEGGDIADPLARGVIERSRVEGELADLARANVHGREHANEIIVFKSVGTAIEDLVAAHLAVSCATEVRSTT